MRVVTSAAALAVGALVALLLGLSMLAASQTTERGKMSASSRHAMMRAGLTATAQSLPAPGPATKSSALTLVKVPCTPLQRVAEQSSAGDVSVQWQAVAQTPAQQRVSTLRQARCLHRHGYLSASDLDVITRANQARIRHDLSKIVPLALQIEPSPVPLTIWSLILALEAAGVFFVVRPVQRKGPGASSP